jgi:hypothetical protein
MPFSVLVQDAVNAHDASRLIDLYAEDLYRFAHEYAKQRVQSPTFAQLHRYCGLSQPRTRGHHRSTFRQYSS